MKEAIITSNQSKHNFKIGEVVDVVSRHKGYYKCKGKDGRVAHYIVPFSEAQILGQ